MKMPIMRPALEAVVFGFERIGMVIRIAWLPVVLVMLLYVGAFALLAGAGLGAVDLSAADREEAVGAIIQSGGLFVGYLGFWIIMPFIARLLLACISVAVTRAATHAAYEPPSQPFYFALGMRELRYFAAQILYAFLISIAAMIAAGLVFGVAGLTMVASEAVDGQAKAFIIAPGAALAIWIMLAWLWVFVRLLPVLPIAAVENRISFDDAWAMTKGNFWRLLLSGALFLAVLQGVMFVLFMILLIPLAIVIGLLATIGSGFVGPVAYALFALLALILIPAMIALSAFTLGAQSAFPARLYAYLTDCGEACRVT